MDEQGSQVRRETARRNGRQWGAVAVAVLIVLSVADRNREWSTSRIIARAISVGLVFPLAYGLALLGERMTRR